MKALLYAGIIFMLACNQASNKTAGDTQPAGTDSLPAKGSLEDIIYTARGHFELPRYSIDIKEKFWDPNKPISERDSSYYFDATMLYIRNKKTNKLDSLKLEMNYDDAINDLAIQDLSDSLGFKTLLLYISWTTYSDMLTGEFVEYTKDTCKLLFGIDELQSIRRKDSKTLEGFVRSRDELVSSFQFDYPFTVSLKDYEVQYIEPAKQYIGYPSEALENIQAYRITASHDSIPYTIQKGTSLRVDTLYRSTNSVRLIIADSIITHADLNKLSEKLQGNTAG